jgi:hypothetical protein
LDLIVCAQLCLQNQSYFPYILLVQIFSLIFMFCSMALLYTLILICFYRLSLISFSTVFPMCYLLWTWPLVKNLRHILLIKTLLLRLCYLFLQFWFHFLMFLHFSLSDCCCCCCYYY